ncbi:hypothetical protein [Nonomuraea jabiensis]|uniref:hypothetical protein n=1 Tax=Nonomuraea jabiensis TaxID=882448 RepID=UPI003D765C4C
MATALLSVAPAQAAEHRATQTTADPASASINWRKYECGDGSTGLVRCRNQHRYYEVRGCDYLKPIEGNATTGYYF